MSNRIITFGWVWAVCFLATWGMMTFITSVESPEQYSGWYLGFIALLVSLPIAAVISVLLAIFRAATAGTEYERKLKKVKGLRILTVSFLVAIAGFAEGVSFGTGIGQVVMFLAFIGAAVGMGVHFYEMFKGVGA